MDINKPIYIAKFLNRPNRFNALVSLNNEEIVVHVPNTGRCKELLKSGVTVLLRKEDNPSRKTLYDLIAVYKGDILVNIDSQMPNKVVKEALNNKAVDKLKKYEQILSEKTFGNSRFDFKLISKKEEYYLEVKGVTLEEDKVCMFPDAPTERGTKHIKGLIELKKQGKGAGILFLIQLNEVNLFKPNEKTDPKFTEALREAKKIGVDIFVYNCIITENSITLDKSIDTII